MIAKSKIKKNIGEEVPKSNQFVKRKISFFGRESDTCTLASAFKFI